MASGLVPKIGMMLCMEYPPKRRERWLVKATGTDRREGGLAQEPRSVSAQQQQGDNQNRNADGNENDCQQSCEAFAAVNHFLIVLFQIGGALGRLSSIGSLRDQRKRLHAGDQESVRDLPAQAAAAQVPRSRDERRSAVGRVLQGLVLLANQNVNLADGFNPMSSNSYISAARTVHSGRSEASMRPPVSMTKRRSHCSGLRSGWEATICTSAVVHCPINLPARVTW